MHCHVTNFQGISFWIFACPKTTYYFVKQKFNNDIQFSTVNKHKMNKKYLGK